MEWEIVRINPTSLQRFLSHLVEQNFPRNGNFDYDIMIVREPSNEVMYRSSPELDVASFRKTADDSVTLSTPGGVSISAGVFATAGRPLAVRVEGIEPKTFDPGPIRDLRNGWQVYAKHHSGSLESFARQFRARNIAVSSAAFVLLALGLACAFISTQRIRAAGKLQLEFAAGLSHELRTPLSVIRSAGYNLVHGSIARKEDVVRYGSMIQQEGIRLAEMVEQALLFAHTQSGRRQYERNPVNVAAVIEDTVASCRELLPKYPCELAANIAQDLPQASTDEKGLGHCVRNIVMNALKYSEKGGRIEISAQTARQKHAPEIEISIANRGATIDPEDLTHIFEPFFRGRNAAGIPGNGLGLYMVESIVKSLNGRVTAASSAGETRFTLYVPAFDTSNTFFGENHN
jgi:signal transduction histidine kinase